MFRIFPSLRHKGLQLTSGAFAMVSVTLLAGSLPAAEWATLKGRFVYDGAGHAFFNDTREDRYHQPSAEIAFERALAFLRS
ncbi:MAG: hypothetical protein EBZ14_11455 [Gammaproteobacteria bacterium]|nr:hypothetical protein [Gammaproteobacteria bacterium]